MEAGARSIRLDGATLDQWSSETLGRHIGYLPQDVELFPGNVAQNIARFERPPHPEAVLAAARAAGVHDLIVNLSDGYETDVGEHGSALSAGQAQRIALALARALYRDPFLVVLDEPNSNLDAEGDELLTRAILGLRARGAIVIVVAHRPSAIAGVDYILVMAKGRQQQFGPKEEILRVTPAPSTSPSAKASLNAGASINRHIGGVVVGQAGAATPAPRVDGAAAQTGFAVRGPDPRPFLVTFPGLLRNVRPIEEAAAGRGLFSINPERDGIVRRVPVVMEAQDALVPALTMEMLRVVTRATAILIRTDDAGVRAVAVPVLEVPTDRNGQFWVHFNKHDPARYVSAADVLNGRTPPDRFRGRLVLIGTSAVGLLDIKTTPVEPAMPGVEVHAQILENVLTKSLLTHPSYAIGTEIVAAVVFGIAIIVAAPMLPAAIVIALGAGLIAGLIGMSLYFFVAQNLLIDFTYPLMSCWLIYLVLTFVNYFREQQQRQQIRSAFGYYLSPPLVEQLAKSPESSCSAARNAA